MYPRNRRKRSKNRKLQFELLEDRTVLSVVADVDIDPIEPPTIDPPDSGDPLDRIINFNVHDVQTAGSDLIEVPGLHPDHPFQNPLISTDVNNDGYTSPIDVLLIIAEMNDRGPGLPVLPSLIHYYDTNGDNWLSAVDALKVINKLNQLSAQGGSIGSVQPDDVAPAARAPVDISLSSRLDRIDGISDNQTVLAAASSLSVAGWYTGTVTHAALTTHATLQDGQMEGTTSYGASVDVFAAVNREASASMVIEGHGSLYVSITASAHTVTSFSFSCCQLYSSSQTDDALAEAEYDVWLYGRYRLEVDVMSRHGDGQFVHVLGGHTTDAVYAENHTSESRMSLDGAYTSTEIYSQTYQDDADITIQGDEVTPTMHSAVAGLVGTVVGSGDFDATASSTKLRVLEHEIVRENSRASRGTIRTGGTSLNGLFAYHNEFLGESNRGDVILDPADDLDETIEEIARSFSFGDPSRANGVLTVRNQIYEELFGYD